MPPKFCSLDPMPTWLTKECLDLLMPIMTKLINSSLMSSIVPADFKVAHIHPLIKMDGLESNTLSNYRPVSNLCFLSRVKVVDVQLEKSSGGAQFTCQVPISLQVLSFNRNGSYKGTK